MKKKFLISIGLSSLLIFGLLFYDFSTGLAGKRDPLENHEFELIQLDTSNQKQRLDFVINENGHFYYEYKDGIGAGNFEAWDGVNFYRYDEEYKDLLIFINHDSGKVIAHPFLSENIKDQISEDINKDKLKKGFLSSVYQKSSKNEDGEEIVEKVEFHKEFDHPQKYTMEKSGEIISYMEIKNIKELDKSINIAEYVDVEKLKADGVQVTELEVTPPDDQQ